MKEQDRFEKILFLEATEELLGWQMCPDHYGHHHLIPNQPRHIHVISSACWCEPFFEPLNQDPCRELWKHNQVH